MQRHVDHYQAHGFTGPVEIFSRAEIETMRRRFFAGIGQSEEETKHIAEDIVGWHAKHRWCLDIARTPRLLDLVEGLFGEPNIVMWSMMFWYKEAGDVTFVPWHQDGAYWAMDPMKNITAWVAFGDVSSGNGCLRFSRRRVGRVLPHPPMQDPRTHFIECLPESSFDPESAVDVEMQSGEACLFDAEAIHMSGPNPSDRARIGCSVRYTTPDVRFRLDEWKRYQPQIVLLRGEDRYGLNAGARGPFPDSAE